MIKAPQPLSRGEAMRKLWDYKRVVRADDLLRPLFDGNDSLSMFEMTAYVSRHLVKQ